MENRPELRKELNSKEFMEYYYLKEELVNFCKSNDLQTTGGKIELTERIAHFLDTGESKKDRKVKNISRNNKFQAYTEIEPETKIEGNFLCSEVHRAFFKKEIGTSFSFNVVFQQWLKNNEGKTYQDAIEMYSQILEDKKKNKGSSKIDKQFEYNTYIRDFFNDNKSSKIGDAILCWKYKKSLKGHNRYEEDDLIVLKEQVESKE